MMKRPSAIAIVQAPPAFFVDSIESTFQGGLDVLLRVQSAAEIEVHMAALRGAPCIVFIDATNSLEFDLLRGLREIGPRHVVVAIMNNPAVDDIVDALRFGIVDILDSSTSDSVRCRLAIDRASNRLQSMGKRPVLEDGSLRDAMQEPERRFIVAALEANNWNRLKTARQLKIDRTTLYKKMKQLQIAA